MSAQLMNCPINYNEDEERRKTHHLFLPKIVNSTKVKELKKNPIEDSMKSNKIALGKLRLLM